MTLTISLPRPILEGIFKECDRYPEEETGGRLIGFYTWKKLDLHIDVKATLPAGPNAKRSRVSFFQDGEYQEKLFRGVEKNYPKISHLGNWHTHHCNGLETLSQGDCQTYRKNVNSPNHATDFFYALLVTTPLAEGYHTKHFVFVRYGGENFYEVPDKNVSLVENGLLKL